MNKQDLAATLQQKIAHDTDGKTQSTASGLLVSEAGMGALTIFEEAVVAVAASQGRAFYNMNKRGVAPSTFSDTVCLLSIDAAALHPEKREYFDVVKALSSLSTAAVPVLIVDMKGATKEDELLGIDLLLDRAFEGVDLSSMSVFASQTPAAVAEWPFATRDRLSAFVNDGQPSLGASISDRRASRSTDQTPTQKSPTP